MAYYEPDSILGFYSVRRLRFRLDHAFILRGFRYRSLLFFSKTKYHPIRKRQIHEINDSLPFRWLARYPAVNVYYDAVFHRYFTGNFLSFYPGPYFTKYFPFDLNFSPTYFADSNQGIYLWYLFWLFVFSLATFHLFKWLSEERNRNRLSKLYAVCNRRGGILLLAVPLIIVNIAAVPPFFVFPSGYGGWKLPAYLVLFITAYVMASSPQFEESIEKNRVPALFLGIITSLLIFALLTLVLSDSSAMERYYVPVSIVWALNGWCWVTAILGFGRKHLSFDHKYLKVSNELVLPFYVLHQSVIVAIAFYVVGLDLSVIEKYLIIVLASFSIIITLLYPISKINLLRFLFGMRMKNRPPPLKTS